MGPGWALVGDAGYFKDPITTHGMTDASRDAELLTDEILEAMSDEVDHLQSVPDRGVGFGRGALLPPGKARA